MKQDDITSTAVKIETSTDKLLFKYVGVKPNLFDAAETCRYNERRNANENGITSG